MSLHRQGLSGALNRSVAILGPGLIGGSLALALNRRRPDWPLSLWSRRAASAIEAAKRVPVTYAGDDLRAAVKEADCVVLCTSPVSMEGLSKNFAPFLRSGAVITDAASVKQSVVASLEAVLGENFAGAHPMAGSEKSGFSAAREDLFENAVCVLTPTERTSPQALATVRELWQAAGCRLREMSPGGHDRAVARVSHLPHAAAAALVHAVAQTGTDFLDIAAGGYRDTTRVAAGSSDLWKEILLDNCAEIVAGIDDMQNSLNNLRESLLRGDAGAVGAWLEEAKRLRDALPPAQ